jgi:antitoxin component YwqK of YwqJK toxin-antitoxin module
MNKHIIIQVILLVGLSQLSQTTLGASEKTPQSLVSKYEEQFEEDEEWPAHKRVGLKLNGNIDGLLMWYDSNERLIAKQNFKDGVGHGTLTQYYPNGKVYLQFDFVYGKAHGEYKRFYPDGKQMDIVIWQDGEGTGPNIVFYPNGNKAEEHLRINGVIQGALKRFRINGELHSTYYYKDGNAVNSESLISISNEESEKIEKELQFANLTFPEVWEKGVLEQAASKPVK